MKKINRRNKSIQIGGIPPICPQQTHGLREVYEFHPTNESTHQHFQEKQNPEQPEYMTAKGRNIIDLHRTVKYYFKESLETAKSNLADREETSLRETIK